jgi:hypothetical protein
MKSKPLVKTSGFFICGNGLCLGYKAVGANQRFFLAVLYKKEAGYFNMANM